MLHGGGGNAEDTQNAMGLDAIADAEGFIAVYPNGTGRKVLGKLFATWSSDEQCCGDALKENVDDVAFISLLIDTLVKEQQVDPKRVYATGLSNGGNMSHRLGCELAQKLAAIAPMGALRVLAGCAPSRPVPVMIVHGTADPCASFHDAAVCGGCFSQVLEEAGLGQPARGVGLLQTPRIGVTFGGKLLAEAFKTPPIVRTQTSASVRPPPLSSPRTCPPARAPRRKPRCRQHTERR
ncbi:MAG: alpha/beta hydrolase family esterase [Myxococcota bacterium]